MNLRKTLIFLTIAFFASALLLANAAEYPGPTEFVEQDFDVVHYDARINLTAIPSTQMSGICRTTLYWRHRNNSSKYYFNLRSLAVDSVFYNGTKIACQPVLIPDSARFHYEIVPPESDQADTAILTIHYSGVMANEGGSSTWGGVHATETGVYAMGVGFTCNYVSTTQFWLPVFDHPQDKATFHCNFVVPTGKVVASNGTMKLHQFDNGTDVYEWTHNIPCATYLLTFAADDYVRYEVPGGRVPVEYYSLQADSAASAYAYHLLPKAIEAFERRFVPYPFEKVGFVNTILGSMEHQTMVSNALGSVQTMYSAHDSLGLVPPHELSHHWFGDLVTCRDFRDAWLNEGFASFCEGIWYEYWNGFEGGFLKRINQRLTTYLNNTVAGEGDAPLYDFPRETITNYPETIYSKGAVVVGMLRYKLGDSLFFGAINKYLTDFAFSNATTQDLKKTIEKYTGQNLDVFFDQWVYRVGYPQIEVNVEKIAVGAQTKAVVGIVQKNPKSWGSFLDVPVEIGFVMPDGTTEYRMFSLGADSISTTMVFDQSFKSIVLNRGPHVRSLAKFRLVRLTSADESGALVDVRIAPNPASDLLRISADQPILEISVVDLFGNELFHSDALNSNMTELPLGGLPQGAYIATVRTRGTTKSEMFSIIR